MCFNCLQYMFPSLYFIRTIVPCVSLYFPVSWNAFSVRWQTSVVISQHIWLKKFFYFTFFDPIFTIHAWGVNSLFSWLPMPRNQAVHRIFLRFVLLSMHFIKLIFWLLFSLCSPISYISAVICLPRDSKMPLSTKRKHKMNENVREKSVNDNLFKHFLISPCMMFR